MAKKKEKGANNSVFEIIVVLAIVAIVAVTGQVLIRYEGASSGARIAGGDLITGNVVVEEAAPEEQPFVDVGVKEIEINPPSPVIGEAFEIRIKVSNDGFVKIDTPFYVQLEIVPYGDNIKPTVTQAVMTKMLEPGEDSVASFNILTVTKEGPMKIIATADSTVKLDDQNPSNNQMSKTVIINSQ